jgi:hypothetical protein
MTTETDTTANNEVESFKDHLEYDEFKLPIIFRMACEGEDTLMPAYEIGRILEDHYSLEYGPDRDEIGGGLREEEGQWWGFVFDSAKVDDPNEVIDDIRKLLENCNKPPEDLREEAQQEWEKSTVTITDLIDPKDCLESNVEDES